jgi:hypothetical protein
LYRRYFLSIAIDIADIFEISIAASIADTFLAILYLGYFLRYFSTVGLFSTEVLLLICLHIFSSPTLLPRQWRRWPHLYA